MGDTKSNTKLNPEYSGKDSSDPLGGSTFDPSGTDIAAAKTRHSTSIGPYILLRKLGEGGMGQVWLVDQNVPVKRQLALKLIKGGMYDNSVMLRFESERQSLAVMNHPTIAKVFDAGATADGQPYFVMEYVNGPPITVYCDQKKLNLRQRIDLFIKVCEGVQHAHQKAIIHRDLKPSNILIIEVDGRPQPRIIDFGIAKAISSRPGADQTVFTQAGALIGTPGFMSPEQADPGIFDIDTRTDVYSLGVILYVLLTGLLPFDSPDSKQRPLDEVLRELREEDAPNPSAKVNLQDQQTATATAEKRRTEPRHLAELLKGDLDWIALKALEKDRTRRYATAVDLAQDLGRYLGDLPVLARPATGVYRLKKYVQRHRVGVGVAAGAAALLVAFTIAQAMQLRRVTRERDRANRITDFMIDMFKVSDPSLARGNAITAREVLDKASTDIDTGLAQDPELQAQLMYVMASVYDELGLFLKGKSVAARAVQIRLHALGPKARETLESQALMGFELWRLGNYSESEQTLREALSQSRRSRGTEQATASLEYHLSLTLADEGRYPEAEAFSRESLQISRRIYGPENNKTNEMLFGLSAILGDEGKYTESEKLNRQALAVSRRVLGPEHQVTIGMMSALADTLSDEGRFTDADQLAQETLDISLRINGPHHPLTAGFTYNVACIAALRGTPDRSLSLLRDAVDRGLVTRTALHMESDPDLKTLHGNPQFDRLVADAKQRAAQQKIN